MIVGVIAVRLAVLRHDVQHINLQGPALPHCVCNTADQKVRDDAGIQASGPITTISASRIARRSPAAPPDVPARGAPLRIRELLIFFA